MRKKTRKILLKHSNPPVISYFDYLNFLIFKDERDAIQKKTFTKWVNQHLIKVLPL